MPVATTFTQDRGIYGKIELKGWKTCTTSNFVVFKDDSKKWMIGQIPSGLSVTSLLPRWWRNTRKDLLEFVALMEAAEPEACAQMANVSGFPMHKDFRPWGQRLVNWARTKA